MVKLIAVLILLALTVVHSQYTPKDEKTIRSSFHKFDMDRNNVFSEKQLEAYFKQDYLKSFAGIEIDPKFIDGTIKYLKSFDADGNGLSSEELVKGILHGQAQKKNSEPHHYPEQQL